MNVLFAVTHHGFGHAARQMEVARRLHELDPAVRVTFWSAVPSMVFEGYLGAPDWWRVEDRRFDVGLVQPDSLGHDLDATHGALEELWRGSGPVPTIAGLLREGGYAHAVVDVPPAVMLGASRAGVPFTVAASFDWAFIYGHYARTDARFERWRDLALEAHAASDDVLWMEPGPDPVGFPAHRPVGLVARRAGSAGAGWRERVARSDERLVLLSFGGFGLERLAERIPRLEGVRWITAPPTPRLDGRDDVTELTGVGYPDLVREVDVVLSKPGYGIITECSAGRTRLVHAKREGFPEIPHLERWMEERLAAVALETLDRDAIAAAIDAALRMPDRFPDDVDGAARIARHVHARIEAAR